MPRNQPRRTRGSTTVPITESDPEPSREPTPVDTTPELIRQVRSHFIKLRAEDPSLPPYSEMYVDVSATTAGGLDVPGFYFGHNKDTTRWTIRSPVVNVYQSEDALEVAWTKFSEALAAKTKCTGCDRVILIGEPCLPCLARQLVTTKECTVCKAEKHNFYKLLCGHSFCKDCVKRTKPRKCPLCRTRFEINDGLEQDGEECECGGHHDYSDDDE